jgi:single-stranded DNA-binding protein
MKGIKAALTGRLSKAAEKHTSAGGRDYVRLNVAVDKKDHDEPTQWVTAMCFTDNLQALADKGQKGARVYVEGSLKTEIYQPTNGRPSRVSITVFAWTAFVMGAIGINDSQASNGKRQNPQRNQRAPRSSGPPDEQPPPPGDADRR